MEVTGVLRAKFETEKVSDRFSKREFVITTEANTPYPQAVSFQLTQDKCNILDRFGIGDEVRLQFNLRGREWNGPQGVKYFNTLECWRMESTTGVTNSAAAQQQQNTSNTSYSSPTFTSNPGDNDDLPF